MGKSVRRAIARRDPAHAAVLFPRAAPKLHAMLTSVGRDRRLDDGYDLHGLRRTSAEFALLQHTFNGRGRVSYEGRDTTVERGQTLLLHFPHDNRYRTFPGQPWDFFWVCLHGIEVMRLWRDAVNRLGPVVTLSDATLELAAEVCRLGLDGELRGPGHASGLAYALAASLVDEAGPPRDGPGTSRRPADVQRVIDHVRENLDRPIPIEELADVAGYSRWHFARRFRASEGLSPQAFLARQRMKTAAAMLQGTDLPIKAVAYRCGFDDPNYFAKAFRQCFRVSPTQFRDDRMFGGGRSDAASRPTPPGDHEAKPGSSRG